MAGLSPKIPLQRSEVDGFYALNKTHVELVKQNFKNLLLTSPGERIMEPNFGVGLRTFLFEQDAQILQDQIVSKIRQILLSGNNAISRSKSFYNKSLINYLS